MVKIDDKLKDTPAGKQLAVLAVQRKKMQAAWEYSAQTSARAAEAARQLEDAQMKNEVIKTQIQKNLTDQINKSAQDLVSKQGTAAEEASQWWMAAGDVAAEAKIAPATAPAYASRQAAVRAVKAAEAARVNYSSATTVDARAKLAAEFYRLKRIAHIKAVKSNADWGKMLYQTSMYKTEVKEHLMNLGKAAAAAEKMAAAEYPLGRMVLRVAGQVGESVWNAAKVVDKTVLPALSVMDLVVDVNLFAGSDYQRGGVGEGPMY